MKLKSHAKINLFLEILGKNKQNYHTLNSLIAFLDIFDEIEINKHNTLSLEINGPYSDFLKNDQNDNIILKTIKLMAKKYQFKPNLNIKLTKNIPIGAGIGGGSSNAATIILAINSLYDLNLSKNELMSIGLEIGADVPIFLNKKMALVEGIGEKLTEINIRTKPLLVLIINPNIHLSTAKIFNNLKIENNQEIAKIEPGTHILDVIKNRRNDLEETAGKFAPQITQILNIMIQQKNCLISRMSGSGSTCFGLFDNKKDLKIAHDYFTKNFPQYYIKKSPLLYEI